jgi:hypothetical protein
MKTIILLLALCVASAAWGADGDVAGEAGAWNSMTGNYGRNSFILCDGSVDSTDRTCTEFDLDDKLNRTLREMQFSIEADAACTGGTATAAIWASNQSAGETTLIATLTQTATAFFTVTKSHRFISVITAGLVSCTDFTVWGTFVE